jgi:hypothetical protein
MNGIPIHQTDKHGVPILTGDTLVCYPKGMGQAERFVVTIGPSGLNLPAGLLPHELVRCEVVYVPPLSAPSIAVHSR